MVALVLSRTGAGVGWACRWWRNGFGGGGVVWGWQQ